MPFEQKKLDKVSNQTRGIFDVFVYEPDNGDTIADIQATGYFLLSRFANDPDWNDSYVICKASDGYGSFTIDESGTAIIIPANIALSIGTNLFTSNDNTTVTPTDDNPSNYVDVLLSAAPLTPPFPEYGDAFSPDQNSAMLTNTDGTKDYSVSISGKVVSDSTANSDKFFLRILQGQGGSFVGFTGGEKRYPAGIAQGQVTSQIGFTFEVFGRFPPNEQIKLQIAKDFAGSITVEDVIFTFRPISAGVV
jgi:hypothetical protein